MREIERIEIEQDPGSRHRVRIPADYFDLAGGTSTGGYVCRVINAIIMLKSMQIDLHNAISTSKSCCRSTTQSLTKPSGWISRVPSLSTNASPLRYSAKAAPASSEEISQRRPWASRGSKVEG